MKEIVILGGPNGAGKTTAARVLLPDFLDLHTFVNADELARGMNKASAAAADLAAGRLMLGRMRDLVHAQQSFAFETTCAGRSYGAFLKQCKSQGWRLTLVFLWLPSPDFAMERVARRVSQGGHSISPEVIVRRFHAGLLNLRAFYLPLADEARIYDNTDEQRVLIAEKELGSALVIHDHSRWSKIEAIKL